MSTQNWLGTATAAAQVATATFGVYDATTTRKITIGGVVVSALDTGGTLTAALTALAVILNGSTHPYFAAITWTSSATQITGTAKTAGVPFVFAGSVSGGTGTCSNAYTVATASSGPNDWSTAANWSTGTVPVTGDDVYLKNNSVNICWGLAQSGVTLNSLTISKSYTGKLGLDTTQFATSSDGATGSTVTEAEYRQAYLQISSTTPINIGEQASIIGTAAGSSRIMIDVGSVASQVIQILGTASSGSGNKPAVRILANSNTCDVYVRSAPAGFGIAMDLPGETSLIRNLYVSDSSSASTVVIGNGVTMTLFEQNGGTNVLQSAATVPTINAKGGTLRTEGTFAVTAANVYNGATLTSNSTGTITTLNPYGGTTDFTGSSKARTVTNLVFPKGSDASIKADGSVLTITNFTAPATKYTLTAA